MSDQEIPPETFTFPRDETYIAFGDASETSNGVFYGLVLIPERSIYQFQNKLIELKVKYGGAPETPIHCREIFAEDARNKSGWKHLDLEAARDLCGDVLRDLETYSPKYLMAHMPSAHYPKRFRLIGKNGHRDLVHDIDQKWLTLWSYFNVAKLLDPAEIIEPTNQILTKRALNLPFWRMQVRRVEQGLRVRKVFLDREHTKIRWFSKSFQWTSVAKELVIVTPNGPSHLPVEIVQEKKHPLIDIADVFSYSAARSMYPENPLEYGNFKSEMYIEILPSTGEEFVLGESRRSHLG